MVLASGLVVPMAVDYSNKKNQVHMPTVICAYLTFLLGLSLRGLVSEFLDPTPGRRRYAAIKIAVHACVLMLASLSFTMSLMMRMNVVVTSLTIAATTMFVLHRLWKCAATTLEMDVEAYLGCEEELQQLLELLFGGWFGMAFYNFQNYPEEVRDARFLPSEYLTFFTSVAASLMLVKTVPQKPCSQPLKEIMMLICAVAAGVVTTSLVIAASKVGGYVVLALIPEAIALAAWCAQRSSECLELPVRWPDEWLGYDHHGGSKGEPSFVSVSLTLLMAVLSYHAKDARALCSQYDEAFVLVTTAAVAASLGWRLLTQSPTPTRAPGGVQAAAKILAFFTFWLLLLSVLAFLGVMLGW
jgi:hypothetical protein